MAAAPPRSFRSPGELRRWLAANGGRKRELWIRFFKKGSGRASVTYPEALDEALCHGWIDGVRKRMDEESYLQRFTPRREGSYWSAVNTARAKELIAAGRMAASGRAAFDRRDESRTERYSYEREAARLTRAEERLFRAVPGAREGFRALPPSLRRAFTWWVVSAKRPETRRRRLQEVIARAAARGNAR